MSYTEKKILYLLDLCSQNKINSEELKELQRWIENSNSSDPIFQQFFLSIQKKEGTDIAFPDWNVLKQKIDIKKESTLHSRKSQMRILPWLAAACLVIMAVSIYLFYPKKDNKTNIAKNAEAIVAAPSSSKATVTLSNGRTIPLDSLNSISGLSYINGVLNNNDVVDNSIVVTNPKGSLPLTIKLSDGSTVYLNTFSSFTYPGKFNGNLRKVSITGEAYFEVAHNAQNPFIVNAGGTTVEVLGTKFNVNAYTAENEVKTTLLQGSVKVKNANQSKVITPGYQAVINSNQISVNQVDIDNVMDWKNDEFSFDDENITDIMNKLSRWYDVEIIYKGDVSSKRFWGTISRHENIHEVLKALELTGLVHFKIDNRRIIVMP